MTRSPARVGCVGVLLLGLGAGCGGGSSNGQTGNKADGGQTGSKVGAGTLSAVIDGVAWTSTASETTVTSSSASPGQLGVTGLQGTTTNYTALSFALGFIAGPGTYPLGVNQGTTPGGTGTVISIASTTTFNDWMTPFSGTAGTITFLTLASGRMTGTFAFTAPPEPGSTATNTRAITDGMFDLAYPDTFTPPSGDNTGSSMSATLNGQPWYAGTVEGLGDTSTGVLSIGGTTTGISLSITTSSPVAAGGTYDQTAISLQATGTGANCCWVGTGGTVSVTITSLTATRTAGTFSATLPVSAGGSATAPLTITDGKFDLLVNPAS